MSATEPLRHLRASTANKRPTPAAMADGQLALNTNNTSPGLFFKDSNGALVKVGPVHVGTTAPNASPAVGGSTGNAIGEQWLDTAGGTYVFKVWDGSAWRSESGTFVDVNGDVMTGALVMDNQQQVRFRETTANGTNFIAIQAPASVSADRTLTLPDVTGTLVSTGDTGSVTSTMIADGTIVNADINASAAIAGTKISPDFGSQNVTTTGTSTSASFTPTSSAVPTNGVYLPAANSVAISTGGSGRLFVDASGNVGVGVSASAWGGSWKTIEFLNGHSFGSAGTQAAVGQNLFNNGSNWIYKTSAPASFYQLNAGEHIWYSAPSGTAGNSVSLLERLRITSAGLVGVGTSSPSDPLHIAVSGANSANIRLQSGDGRTYNIGSTGSGYGSSGKFIIYDITAGAERFCINSSGNVGVGTTSPASTLHVNGTTSAYGNGAASLFWGNTSALGSLTYSGTDVIIQATGSSSGNLLFLYGGNERARIDSSGRVGIGTSSPAVPLHVSGDGNSLRLQRSTYSGTGETVSLDFRHFASNLSADYAGATITSVTTNSFTAGGGAGLFDAALTFSTLNDAVSAERMRISSSGNVGIGTTSPRQALTFGSLTSSSTSTPDCIDLGATFTSTSASTNLKFKLYVDSSGNTYGFTVNGSSQLEYYAGTVSSPGNHVFLTGGSERARIDSSGRLLVGTSSTSSASALVVQNNSSGNGVGVVRINYSTNSPGANDTLGVVSFGDNTHGEYASVAGLRDGGTWSGSSKPTKLVFSTTADGASSPTERLYLYSNGYVRAPGVYALTTAVAADVRVDAEGYLYRSTSSIRYKKDVETLRDEYADAILNARPVWFRSLSKKDNPDWGYWGFIAEEIEQIDPRLCTYSTNEDGEQQVESVQYDRFVPHLLNLIKRQQQAIETLEAKVAALESA